MVFPKLKKVPGSDEVYIQEQLTELLLSYTPRWLQLGLGIVLSLNTSQSRKVCRKRHDIKCFLFSLINSAINYCSLPFRFHTV